MRLRNYVKDLQNQIMMEQIYYGIIYSTQTKIRRTIHSLIRVHLSQTLPGKSQNNRSHIISNRILPGYSLYSGNNQRSKLNSESSSMPASHIELFYCLTRRLLFTSKIARPDVLDCVTYILTMMELPTKYHNRNLNIELLFVKKTRMFVVSLTEDQCSYFETLFYKYKNYILIILQ